MIKKVGFFLLLSFIFPHIGIENAYFEGNIGPYASRIIIEPPGIVPGLATIRVFSIDNKIKKVMVRPNHYDASIKDTLSTFLLNPEEANKSDAIDNLFYSELWLMAYGAYGIEIFLDGDEGEAKITIPVNSLSFKLIEMSFFMKIILFSLLLLLYFGAINIVSIAYSHSTLDADQKLTMHKKNKIIFIRIFATVIITFFIYLGYNWWLSIEKQFIDRLYKPYATVSKVSGNTLNLKIESPSIESSWIDIQGTIREHGKIITEHKKWSHIYIFDKEKSKYMAHLHPMLVDDYEFESCLPPMDAGEYLLYADVIHEDGYSHSISSNFHINSSIDNKNYNSGLCDKDNSYAKLEETNNNFTIKWSNKKDTYNTNDDINFQFKILNGSELVELDTYVSMGSHAVILNAEEEFYMHLHPLGSISMSAQKKFMGDESDSFICDFGVIEDEYGNYKVLDGMGQISFPSLNLKPGSYLFYIQVKIKETQDILTKKFNFIVL